MALSATPHETLLRNMFMAGLDAAAPELCLIPHIPPPPSGRTIVVGAGKAAGSMAMAFEKHWRGAALSGLVVTRYGHACPTRHIEVVEAAHPIPDDAGQRAAQRMLDMVRSLSADDLVVCLISGGGSALLALP
ncbi:MAG: glycerate-2-kinase family protein, partial [Rhodospirillaceae bacterium]|nr:glycerate-2-kinase family protein [Rhodospirillaceae bacterium]